MSTREEKVFSGDFLRMFLANSIMCSGFYMMMPVLPQFAVSELNIDPSRIGFILGVFSISAVISRPIAGVLLDRNDRMKIYIPTAVLFGLCFGSYVLAFTFGLLIIMRIIHGISWGAVSTSTNTIVSDIVPTHLRGRGLGYFGVSMNLSMALGPALATLLMDHTGFNFIFILSMALVFFALIFSFKVSPPKVEKVTKKFKFSELYEKKVLLIALLEFLFGIVYASIMSYSVLHAGERGIRGLGLFFIIFAIFVSILRPFAGKLMDKRGPFLLLMSGYVLLFLGYILLASAHTEAVFLLSAVPLGIAGGFIMPILLTMTINIVEPSRRGAANATLFSAFDIGIGLGAILLGIIANHFGFGAMYYFCAVFNIIPAVIFVFFTYGYYKRCMKKLNK